MKKNHIISTACLIISKRLVMSIFTFILILGNINGQQKPTLKKKMATKIKSNESIKKATGYSIIPFDLNKEKIPIAYNGIDPILLFNKLESRSTNLIKNEFETTAQYQERIAKTDSVSIIGKLNKNSYFAFKVNIRNLTGFKVSYNADEQLLNVKLILQMYTNYELKNSFDYTRKSVELKEISNKSIYLGSNAFGATQRIEKSKESSYHVLIDNWENFTDKRGEYETDTITCKFNLDAIHSKQIVKSIKTNNKILGCLIIGKLSHPFSCTGYSYFEPTLDSPFEYITYYKYINLQVYEIWFYNTQTGLIYSKLKAQPKRNLFRH